MNIPQVVERSYRFRKITMKAATKLMKDERYIIKQLSTLDGINHNPLGPMKIRQNLMPLYNEFNNLRQHLWASGTWL